MWWNGATRLLLRLTGDTDHTRLIEGPGAYDIGPAAVAIEAGADRWAWSIGVPATVAVDAIAFEFDCGPAPGPVPMFVHGYQSWAPTRTRLLGVDDDPSRDPRSVPLVRAAYHADPGVGAPGELRSEQVTVLDLGPRGRLALGFAGGDRHAGTFRARIEDGRVVVRAEAWLGGATLPAGTSRALHDVLVFTGDDPVALLEQWAARVGGEAGARVGAPYQVGWCSWYHYFHDVDERAITLNLARASGFPFDVFQLDDGYQAAIGDWLATNDKFPGGVDGVAAAIVGAGMVPGIWIAPFLAEPASRVARDRPDLLARAPAGDERPAIGMFHEVWGGIMWQLDTTNPDTVLHLERSAAALVDAGYRYLKLDFTFSAAMPGRFHDPTQTPAQRVRAGYDAIRRGAGDDVFILGCGAPLGPLVGAVDGMRIGADVAPWWTAPPDAPALPGYEEVAPSTRNAFVNTCTRAFQHRRLWLNDPDCIMLRTTATQMAPDAVRGWARTVGASGGMALVSDDLALLGREAQALLAEVTEMGRNADRQALAGAGARPLGIDDRAGPAGLASAAGRVRVDPDTGCEDPVPERD
jgi:alpha-galactosidase